MSKDYLIDKWDSLDVYTKMSIVSIVNIYTGELDELNYYENNEDFFNTFYSGRLDELVRAICYGDYNYTDEYVKINVYGNIESATIYNIENELDSCKDEIIDAVFDNNLEAEVENII